MIWTIPIFLLALVLLCLVVMYFRFKDLQEIGEGFTFIDGAILVTLIYGTNAYSAVGILATVFLWYKGEAGAISSLIVILILFLYRVVCRKLHKRLDSN